MDSREILKTIIIHTHDLAKQGMIERGMKPEYFDAQEVNLNKAVNDMHDALVDKLVDHAGLSVRKMILDMVNQIIRKDIGENILKQFEGPPQ